MNSALKTKYEILKTTILEHDYHYYVLDRPQISDFEYDKLYAELLHIEAQNPSFVSSNSPSQRISGAILPFFEKATHRLPMLSLANSYSVDDIEKFDLRIKNFLKLESDLEYLCEPKFDGLAIELVYINGVLDKAITRGDGQTGEDVTDNIKTIKSIPLSLKSGLIIPKLIEIRGEVLIFKEAFQRLNEFQEKNDLPTFANPRNAAAGTVRQLDSKIALSRPLRFFAYGVSEVSSDLDLKTQFQLIKYLSELGLPTAYIENNCLIKICKNHLDVADVYYQFEKMRKELKFEIDGMVIKVNDLSLQNQLGLIARSPRWATAAKFKPEQAITTIEDIQIQVGRTGALTPVAIMKPVRVGGVQVTNATLHNKDEIERKNIRIGDTVIIQRAGDVIPEIVGIIEVRRPKTSTPFHFPDHCPECNSKVLINEEESIIRCGNPICPAIIKESLKHFVSRRAMNIEKLGDKAIEKLVGAKKLSSFSDIYRLTESDIIEMERQGEKSALNILMSIESSKKTTLARFIYALGIRFVGEQTARHLAFHYGTINRFLDATEEDLLKVPEIGPKVAEAILTSIKNSNFKSEISKLIQLGICMDTRPIHLNGVLNGLTFLITGTLPIGRETARETIEKNGGRFLSGVSKKLNFLIIGEDPGSKLEKAQELGVKIISWDELNKMIEN